MSLMEEEKAVQKYFTHAQKYTGKSARAAIRKSAIRFAIFS